MKDEIEYRGISQRKLAEQMGLGYSVLNEILNARRSMTEKTALYLLYLQRIIVQSQQYTQCRLQYL